jgi:5-methylcytosine-specific restriction enzyme subunit McrC
VFELAPMQATEIRQSGLVEVGIEPDGRWRLTGDSRIGVAVGPTWEVRVHPRIEVGQLYFLLGYAADPKGWSDQQASFDPDDDLFQAISSGFAWHASRALEQGVLRGYVQVDERRQGLRGRIRFGDQIARGAGLPIPVEVTYDDYTTDIAENRILKSAAHTLLRFPRLPQQARRGLLQLRATLDEVALLDRPREVTMPLRTRLNERYRLALRLAQLILRGGSLQATAGPTASIAFVFDMNSVFEDFLSIALTEAFEPHGGDVTLQHLDVLDVGGGVSIRPDVVWRVAATLRAVIDAKHKELGAGGMPKAADAYQMLAYCTSLGMRRGYLVYAKNGGAAPRDLMVRNANCQICVRAVDISKPPPVLLAEIEALAGEIATQREGAVEETVALSAA